MLEEIYATPAGSLLWLSGMQISSKLSHVQVKLSTKSPGKHYKHNINLLYQTLERQGGRGAIIHYGVSCWS